jgi:hypothetical protein
MASIDALVVWNDGDPHSKMIAKRTGQTFHFWAEKVIDTILDDGQSTEAASGAGRPLTHVIVWTEEGDTTEITITVRSWAGQADLDSSVAAIKDAIAHVNGTVVSG